MFLGTQQCRVSRLFAHERPVNSFRNIEVHEALFKFPADVLKAMTVRICQSMQDIREYKSTI